MYRGPAGPTRHEDPKGQIWRTFGRDLEDFRTGRPGIGDGRGTTYANTDTTTAHNGPRGRPNDDGLTIRNQSCRDPASSLAKSCIPNHHQSLITPQIAAAAAFTNQRQWCCCATCTWQPTRASSVRPAFSNLVAGSKPPPLFSRPVQRAAAAGHSAVLPRRGHHLHLPGQHWRPAGRPASRAHQNPLPRLAGFW